MTSPVDDNTDAAVNGPQARATNNVDGTGSKIGILYYSFNTQGGEAAAIADGALPASGVTVLSDASTPSTDEGLAMAETIHSVAPGAQLYFASVGNSDASFAAAIAALQAAGVTVMVDGYGFVDQPFFQVGGAVDAAVNAATAAGITYITAAGNLGSQFYQEPITMGAATLPGGVGAVSAFDFSLGQGTFNPLQSVTVPLNTSVTFDLQWTQPFKSFGTSTGSAYTLDLYLYDSNNNVVAQATTNAQGGDPVQFIFNYQNTTGSTAFHLAITAGNGTPSGVLKYLVLNNSAVTINDPNAGKGSGTLFGQQLDPNAITVGDVDYHNTPEAGGTLQVQTATSVGPGQLYYDASGNALATPQTLNKVNVVAPVGSTTTLAGLSPYYGTTAAAANVAGIVALMQRANPKLTPADISTLLGDSALSVPGASAAAAGSGLVQADRAVAFAATGTITMAAGGTRVLYGTSQPTNFALGTGANTINLGSGPSQVLSAGTDTITAGSGADTINVVGTGALVFGAAGTLVMTGGAGANTVFGATGAETLVGGTGGMIAFGGSAGGNVLVAGASASILVGGGSGDQMFAAGGGGDVLFGPASGSVVMGAGASTAGNVYVADGANAQIGTGAGGNTVYLGAGGDIVFDNGADTVIGNTGNATVAILGGSTFLEAGSGNTLIDPVAGTASVFGTTGSETVFAGGAGGGYFKGGFAGKNLLFAGAAASTLVGGGSADSLFAAGGAGDVLYAGAGNETLSAGASTGANVFVAGGGADLIAGGIGGGTFLAGTGSATLFGGGGANVYEFVKGTAGGTDLIENFVKGTDKVLISGYGTSVATLVAGQVSSGAITTLTLSDNTKVLFVGVGTLGASSFISS